MLDLSVITVTYNSTKVIKDYLDSLHKSLPERSEIIIIDSGSNDGTVEFIRERIKEDSVLNKRVKIIESKENLGFGKGNNLAAKEAKGEYLFFLNPDAYVQGYSLELMLNYAKENPLIGVVGPKLIEPSGQVQPSVRRLPSLIGAFKEYYLKEKNAYEAFIPQVKEAIEVESVVGASILIKKDIFNQVGGFDDKYFMYYEDLELCRKLRKLGLKVIYMPNAEVGHRVGGSVSDKKTKWLHESARKYHGIIIYFLLQLLFRFRKFLVWT